MESMELLDPDELERIERENAGGLPATAILEIFRPRGVRLSEATFRKYVQAGLLPRSRRVGRKGKHQGSLGLYPVEAVRRINVIKRMMAEGHTLEDIRRSFVFHRNHIDQLERDLAEVLDGFQEELGERSSAGSHRRVLEAELATLRQRAQDLVRDVARLGSAVTAREDETIRSQ
ncbi:MerR family transcriptional regulator [Corallococcus sp. H22C18031201]|uniref:MerR family transcriptional regulator n=1 Tax=Citreicoccus inhibens TaxID=2849499 RepID=UPI000E752E3F|nr:MerR family transcriptional regulator [Citreicoccus inhibens]MBU8896904.1 helix-turn-helix domain-containing protein [Citreicoccus inhibens]RJS20798.1 MerR family transcriptional regulator [Corallococcus sp. H22C18031201]